MLSDAVKAELKATADALSSPGKGFLASDESAGPWLRAGHVEAKKIPDTPENRAACALAQSRYHAFSYLLTPIIARP